MFSYRHSFHAGNHGDVLKHICQMLIMEKLREKAKPYTYIDTHSGAGVYHLDHEQAQKTGEYKQGISRLGNYQGANKAILNYHALCEAYLAHQQYPGSPEIAKHMLREQDSGVLMEWLDAEAQLLKRNMSGTQLAVHHRDGYEGLLAVCPPKAPRGLVLIDPPYEVPSEYQQVVNAVTKAHKRWSTGIYTIWYPLLSARPSSSQNEQFATASKVGLSERMLEELVQHPFNNLLKVEMHVSNKNLGGMYGTGLAIINAPWQLDEQIHACLSELTPLMAQDDSAKFNLEWLIKGS